MSIDHANLAHLDLNLLVALDALLMTRSVTQAGRLLGIGQSAMSYNLARLRNLLGDELLTRHPGGMRRTPRAEALVVPVRQALSGIQALLGREASFAPATAERLFRIALPDSMEVLLMPQLLAQLHLSAPGIRLRLHDVDPVTVLRGLDEDRIDLGIGIGPFAGAQTHHKRRRLLTDSYLCLFNPTLTGVTAPLALDDYLRLPHVLTSLRPGEHGVVDAALAARGLARSIALITPRFMSVPVLVAQAPVVATMHARPARLLAEAFDLQTSPPPVTLPPVEIEMLWHTSYDQDQAHLWLRNAFLQASLSVGVSEEEPSTGSLRDSGARP